MTTQNKIQITVTMLADVMNGETVNSTIEHLSKHLEATQDMVRQSKDCAINFQWVTVPAGK